MIAGDQVAQGILCGRLQIWLVYAQKSVPRVLFGCDYDTLVHTKYNCRIYVPRIYELCTFFIRNSLSWLPNCHYTLLLPQMSVT